MKIVLNSAGVREMLQSAEIQAVLRERANEIAARAGDGYTTDVFAGKTRANASVFANTPEAIRDNLNNDTLLKALR